MANQKISNFLLYRAAPWILSLCTVLLLTSILVLNTDIIATQEDKSIVRSLDLALPPPPPPPPPVEKKSPQANQPTINIMGQSNGPKLQFSENPKMATATIERIEQPNFDLNAIDFSQALTVNYPIFEVKELDQVPRLISNNRISFPRDLRKRGIKRIPTVVEIVIDQNGRAFVKKIVDPVYPEMVETIRKAINNSKFTIPMKSGKPVQAIYLYNLVFIDRT